MRNNKNNLCFLLTAVSPLLLSACLNSGSTSSPGCPAWAVGDAMTYQTIESVGGVPYSHNATWTVMAHTANSLSLSTGTLNDSYLVQGKNYIPQTENVVFTTNTGTYTSLDTYSSTTAFCSPPDIGQSYQYTTFIPSPAGRGGDYVLVTLTVTERKLALISLPLGSFTATKLVMAKVGGRGDSTVTRYYVDGVGVVLENEDIPSSSTTITKELTAYSYQ